MSVYRCRLGFIRWGGGGGGGGGELPPKGKGKDREKEREREEEEEVCICFWYYDIYLITSRLAEYLRIKSITPQCHYGMEFNVN